MREPDASDLPSASGRGTAGAGSLGFTWIIDRGSSIGDSAAAMNIITRIQQLAAASAEGLPDNVFRYVLATSAVHQLLLLALTVSVFLLEIVPLELQRRVVNDLVKNRPYSWVIMLCAAYAGVVLVQGGTKLVLNVYRGWVGERAVRDLRQRIHAVIDAPATSSPAAEAQGIAVSMIVAEVEPIGGFVGGSISEPLLQGGILLSVLAYLVHLDPWMALGAFALFVPQFFFVPLLQAAVNWRAGARVRILRQLGIDVIDHANANFRDDDQRIERVFALDMGIFRLKFTMNFLMNLCSHLQIVSALLIGGWWVYTDRLEIGAVVAFISGIGRLNDPWGDLVNYFRDVNVTQVKYRLLANAVNQLDEMPEARSDCGEPARMAEKAGAIS
jgi:ABC-type multidrug transport system fused ATPase/permease subunit